MKQETDVTGRARRRAEAMENALAGGHVEGHGWRMGFLRRLARARADGLLTAEQIKRELPSDLLLAVEALAEELRRGNHAMPLVVIGNDWDFAAEEDKYEADQLRLNAIRRHGVNCPEVPPGDVTRIILAWLAVLSAAAFAAGLLTAWILQGR